MGKKYGRKMLVSDKDRKYANRFNEFINVVCDMSIIGEKKLCSQCEHAMRRWERENQMQFWELFRLRGKYKQAGILRFLELFICEIDEDRYSEMDYDDIIETIELALRATFKNELGKVFPRLPEIS